jgi:hypothetical protein
VRTTCDPMCYSSTRVLHAYATCAAKLYARSQSRSEFGEELCISVPQYCTMQSPVDYVYLTPDMHEMEGSRVLGIMPGWQLSSSFQASSTFASWASRPVRRQVQLGS